MKPDSYTTGRLGVTIDAAGTVTLDGQIDERCELLPIAEKVDGTVRIRPVVSFINSIGVREWIRLLHTLRDNGSKVRLADCSEALVHQMNMIVEAQAGATVESFYAPYACEKCGHESSMRLDMSDHGSALQRKEPPSLDCNDCGGEMELNEIVARYLLFLDNKA